MQTADNIKTARDIRNKMLNNQYRPKYHVASPEGVSIPFDPNGAIHYKGRYHLFYILQEEGVHCWGHISSSDLLHWVYHPNALFPTDDSPESGIFSGSAFLTACNPSDYGYDSTLATVYTPKGTAVTGAMIEELTTADYNDLNNQTAQNYPNATKLREPTNHYNCHSYAWYSQSTSNTVWIGIEGYDNEQKKYWTDGSYVNIATASNGNIPSSVPNGSKVDYYSDDHSAIKTSSTEFTSKWGPAGLFRHSPSYCPYSSSTLKYYQYNKK